MSNSTSDNLKLPRDWILISLEDLVEDPDDTNYETKEEFQDHLGEIERTGNYKPPLTVRPLENGKYLVKRGNWRLKAIKILRDKLGIDKVQCVIDSTNELESDVTAMLDNKGGKDDVKRTARKVRKMLDKNPKMTHKELGQRLQFSEDRMSFFLGILELSEEVQNLFSREYFDQNAVAPQRLSPLTFYHWKAVRCIKGTERDIEIKNEMLKLASEQQWSSKELETRAHVVKANIGNREWAYQQFDPNKKRFGFKGRKLSSKEAKETALEQTMKELIGKKSSGESSNEMDIEGKRVPREARYLKSFQVDKPGQYGLMVSGKDADEARYQYKFYLVSFKGEILKKEDKKELTDEEAEEIGKMKEYE